MKIFFLLTAFILTGFFCFGQQSPGNDSSRYTQYKFQYGERIARYWADSVLVVPGDTLTSKSGLAKKGTTLYVGDGHTWNSISSMDSIRPNFDSSFYKIWNKGKVIDSFSTLISEVVGIGRIKVDKAGNLVQISFDSTGLSSGNKQDTAKTTTEIFDFPVNAPRLHDVFYDVMDASTNEMVTFEKVTTWYNGSPMDDSKIDSFVYRKKGSEYFRRVFPNKIINVTSFGARPQQNVQTRLVQIRKDLLVPVPYIDPKAPDVIDNTASFRAATRMAEKLGGTLYVPRGVWPISDSINFIGTYNVDAQGTIYYTGAEVPYSIVTIGRLAVNNQYIYNANFFIERVHSNVSMPTDTLFTGINLLNLLHCNFQINNIFYFGTALLVSADTVTKPFAYNTVTLPHTYRAIHGIKIESHGEGTNAGWINQNRFLYGSLHSGIPGAIGLVMRARANSNVFHHLSVEVGFDALCGILITKGTQNTWHDIRNEGNGANNTPFLICDGAATYKNVVNVQTNDYAYLHSQGVQQTNGAYDNMYIDYIQRFKPQGKSGIRYNTSVLGQDTARVWWSALDSPIVVTDPVPSITFKQNVYTQALTQLGVQTSKKGVLILGSYDPTINTNEIRFGNGQINGAGDVYVNNTKDISQATSDGILAMQFKRTGDIIFPVTTTTLGTVGIGVPATIANALSILDTSLTGSPVNIIKRWNAFAGTPAISVNMLDAINASTSSKIIDLNVDGVSKFNVGKTGAATVNFGTGTIKVGDPATSSPNLSINTGTGQVIPYLLLNDAGNTGQAYRIEVGRNSLNALAFYHATGSLELGRVNNSGNWGFSVPLANAISARLHSISTAEQLRLGYDYTKYISFTVGSTGNLTIGGTTGAVGIGAAPVVSAKLDVTSTTQGFLPPRMTTVQQNTIATPAVGLLVYNTDSLAHTYFNGSAWKTIGSGSGWLLTGNPGTNSSHFVGTTDIQPLSFKVNNILRMKIEQAAEIQFLGQGAGTTATPITTVYDIANVPRITTYTNGTQTWWLNGGSSEVGRIAYSSPANVPGIAFFDATGNSRSDFRLVSGGGLSWGSNATSAVPTPTMFLTNGGSLGIGQMPAVSAKLDIASTTQGTLLPRMTKAQRDAIGSPAQGLMVFVTDGTGYLSWYNAGWQKVTAAADP